jgi:ribA/ribD-fused uncharacterized protein
MEGPPKFAPFKKGAKSTRVVLTLEATPAPSDQHTDLTSFVPKTFTTGAQLELVVGGDGPAVEVSQLEGMFAGVAEKKAKGAKGAKAKGAKGAEGAEGAEGSKKEVRERTLAETLLRTKIKTNPPGEKKAYVRYNVSSREQQAKDLEALAVDERLTKEAKTLLDIEATDPYNPRVSQTEIFAPMTRRGFGTFIKNKFRPIFPSKEQRKLDVASCKAKGDEGDKEVKIYHYQEFIREYMRYETPYRGLLVYHGLGSGKTCSAIAAAEALFGTHGMKIIIMTPYSLRDNFISEINFCGFKHFRLDNNWTPFSLMPGSTPDPELVKLFAKTIYKIPDSFFTPKGRARVQVSRIWIPDFEQGAGSTPFKELSDTDRNEIQTQLKQTIENRIQFINYNGIQKGELKSMICSTPDIFDNAVIVVDEIHNLTRLIQGSLERPFTKATPREVLTPDRTPLPKCATSDPYDRGYLFYRLFMDAKNTKIIGLSGTPLINFPEELGILANILHGPLHVLECTVAVNAQMGVTGMEQKIEDLVRLDENLDTVFFTASEGSITVTITRLPEQFTKILDDKQAVIGIKRRDPLTPVPRLAEVWEKFQVSLKGSKIRVLGTPIMKAQELLPSWDTAFRGAFLEADGIRLRNTLVLKKRLRGLISHYRGIQGKVMPEVVEDVMVGIPLKGYALSVYNKLRNQEIQVEMSKPKGQLAAADAIWAEIADIANMKTPSNYRMSSRQACNFVFPEGVTRPRPRTEKDQDVETGKDRDTIPGADIEGAAPGRGSDEQTPDDTESSRVGGAGTVAAEQQGGGKEDESSEKEVKAAVTGQVTTVTKGDTVSEAEAYRSAIRSVKIRLREMGPTHLRLDGPSKQNLEKYSPKFAAMIRKINDLPGSSLVYSQFLEMEGIGIFGICMEANDYVPIEIIPGPDGKPQFSERTRKSLEKGPGSPEKRYIEFTGAGDKDQRAAAVNVFNCRIDKLSSAMAETLEKAGWKNNWKGELCRVFCITSAGAEGLSLKTVRGVHIMEPYWNTVRTQQVKGRAVRICSHMDLEDSEQNVRIYTYCTTIPEEAIAAQAVDKTLERSDSQIANDLIELGVPVPEVGAASEADFLKAETLDAVQGPNGTEVPEGSQASLVGPVEFHYKTANQYRSFSTFAPSFMTIDGKDYKTVENYVQSKKFPNRSDWEDEIRVAVDPVKARQLADAHEKEQAFDKEFWEKTKKDVMLKGLLEKFKQNRKLLELLKSTGTRPLIETSSDPFWGRGRTGKGENWIGRLLESVRLQLRDYVVPEALADQKLPEDVDFTMEESPSSSAESSVESESESPEYKDPRGVGGAGAEAAPPSEEELTRLKMERKQKVEKRKDKLDERVLIITSDQKVLMISLRKEKVIGGLQNIMKSVSVDCELNQIDNGGDISCLSMGDSIGSFAYHPDLQKDIKETEAKYRVSKVADTGQ